MDAIHLERVKAQRWGYSEGIPNHFETPFSVEFRHYGNLKDTGWYSWGR